MFQTVHPECHQQRSFTLKMHRNRWRLGLCRRPHWGAYSAPPKPSSWIKGGYFYGKGREGGKERRGQGRRGTLDPHNFRDRLMPLAP